MVFFDPVQLSELIEFTSERIYDLHAFEKLRAAFLVTSIFLTLRGVEFGREITELVLQASNVTLFSSKFHNFLTELMEKCILVSFLSYD